MARARKRTKDPTNLVLEVSAYQVSVQAGINSIAGMKDLRDGDTKIYSFNTVLTIEATCIRPSNRAGQKFKITIRPGDQEDELTINLRDYRDKYGWHPGGMVRRDPDDVPLPKQIGHFEYQSKGGVRIGAVWVPPQTVSDMLAVMQHHHPLYLDLLEIRDGRNRAIEWLYLKTVDSEEI